eukprot:16435856-Heterocapsa_arctica.AAC.1
MQTARGPTGILTGPGQILPGSPQQGPGRDNGSRRVPRGLPGNRESCKEGPRPSSSRIAALGNQTRGSKPQAAGPLGQNGTSHHPRIGGNEGCRETSLGKKRICAGNQWLQGLSRDDAQFWGDRTDPKQVDLTDELRGGSTASPYTGDTSPQRGPGSSLGRSTGDPAGAPRDSIGSGRPPPGNTSGAPEATSGYGGPITNRKALPQSYQPRQVQGKSGPAGNNNRPCLRQRRGRGDL